ncbi:unknown [Acidiphilium sp. CAG:727]|nr:unknown [Acidiphilium sp. CAG:727]
MAVPLITFFEIKNFPDDVYKAVGKIIQSSQELERDYKTLATKLKLKVKDINNSSLNKLNNALKKSGNLTPKEYNNLKEVIRVRNDINHKFFIEIFDEMSKGYDEMMVRFSNVLNYSQCVIYEANDVIKNKIDTLDGKTIMRRTAFDDN